MLPAEMEVVTQTPLWLAESYGLTPGTDAFVLTKHADVARVVKDPERFPSLTQARVGEYAGEGMSAEQHFAAQHNMMVAAIM